MSHGWAAARSRVVLVAVVVIVALAGCTWPMFRANPAHTGFNAEDSALTAATASSLTRLWRTPTGAAVDSSVAVSSELVYVGDAAGRMHALFGATGTSAWTATIGGTISSSPAVANGVVYVGSTNGSVVGLDAKTGGPRWSAATSGPVVSSPTIDGTRLFVGSDDHNLYAFDIGGGPTCSGQPAVCTPLWTVTTGGPVASSPAVVSGIVYVGSSDGTVEAVDEATGAVLWTAATGSAVHASPAVANGIVVVGTQDGHVDAFDAAGSTGCTGLPTTCAPLWTVTTGAAVDASVAIAQGVVYVAGEDGVLRAVDLATGASKWTSTLPSGTASSPSVSGGVVFVGASDGTMSAYAVSDGTPLWSTATGGAVRSSPALADGRVYVGSADGGVSAYAVPPTCPTGANRIDCENRWPGAPRDEWDITGQTVQGIDGFATAISVNVGATEAFKVDTVATAYHLDIYRLGYYGGAGARKVASVAPSVRLPQHQPACLSDPQTQLVDCGDWRRSATWTVPATAVSGIYVAKLVRDDGTEGVNHIVFVVRDDARASSLLFQTSDTTWEAYNDYGGSGLYTVGANNRKAVAASYNRPFTNRARGVSWLFGADYPMVRFLEANGYDVSYASGVDTDRYGSHLLRHRAFLSVGHDEYWSAAQRAHVDAARDHGVDLGFFGGNTMYWKTRWQPSIDSSHSAYRTLVTYKESCVADVEPFCELSSGRLDPTATWTGLWRDARFSPPADGGRPENATTGQTFVDGCCASRSLTVDADAGRLRLWRDTDLATLAPGTSATFGDRVVGYEWDRDVDNGARPRGLIDLSSTDFSVPAGGAPPSPSAPSRRVTSPNPGTGDIVRPPAPVAATARFAAATQSDEPAACAFFASGCVHHLTLWRAPSGALVFGAGTVQWSFGLDGATDGGSTPDVRIQQATINVLADMGVQPAHVLPGLVVVSASTDTTPPTSRIALPTPLSREAAGSLVTVAGTAGDAGGQVGGVEVSVDGGSTWHPATGRTHWSYGFTPTATGPITIRSRATDDSGNVETPSAGVTLTAAPPTCPCTLFGSTTPIVDDSGPTAPAELGTKFTTDVAGHIAGVRFYKSAANVGVHTASLWTAGGTLLASALFVGETASGWQEAAFTTPVAVDANTVYVASYHTDSGHRADDLWFSTFPAFDVHPTGFDAPPLHVPAPSGAIERTGVSAAGPSAFPNTPSLDENFWVDPVFVP